MKECCDENLKSALARLFYDVFSGWKELSRNGVLQYPLMFISRRDRKICVFIKEIADNPYTIDNLRSFIEHVDYLYHMPMFCCSDERFNEVEMRRHFLFAVKSKIQDLIKKSKLEFAKAVFKEAGKSDSRYVAIGRVSRVGIEDGMIVKERVKAEGVMKTDITEFKKKFLKLIDMSILDTYVSEEHKAQCIDAGVNSLFEGAYTAEYLKACRSYAWDEWGEEKKPGNLSLMQHRMRYSTLCKVRDKVDGMIKNSEICDVRYPSILGDSSVVTINPPGESFKLEIGGDSLWWKAMIRDKPEDTYKPGDRVFFVRQHMEYPKENTYIGVIKDWMVEEGRRICKIEKSFHILNSHDYNITTRDLHEQTFNDGEFEKSLIHNSKDAITGNLSVYRIDEKHFPKLNSIVANIAKPEWVFPRS